MKRQTWSVAHVLKRQTLEAAHVLKQSWGGAHVLKRQTTRVQWPPPLTIRAQSARCHNRGEYGSRVKAERGRGSRVFMQTLERCSRIEDVDDKSRSGRHQSKY